MPKKPKPSMKKQVASLVEAALNKSVKYEDQVNDEEKYIRSMVQAAVTKTLNQNNDQQSQDKPKVYLNTHSQRGFDFKVLFQIEPPIFILKFHSKL